MRHFIDFEFLEDGETIVPISIGIATPEDASEYYAVFSEIQTDPDLHRRICEHDFLAKHVIKHLPLVDDGKVAAQLDRAAKSSDLPYFRPASGEYASNAKRLDWSLDLTDPCVKPKWVIANEVRQYFATRRDGNEIELWANYAAYDHVCLMQLWGPMVNRPEFLPMFPHDLQAYARFLGVDRKTFPKQEAAEHDALADARHDVAIWEYLEGQRVRHLMAAD